MTGAHVSSAALAALLLYAGSAAAGEIVPRPRSYAEIKFAATVRQQFDFSCGAATLATVLTHYWGRKTGEIEVLNVLRARYPDADWPALQKKGFSFDDLIWTAKAFGFEGQGAELSAFELEKLDGPVIVHLTKGSFEHFSVVRAVRAGRVYMSDPIIGAVSIPIDEFARQYTGEALAIWKRGAVLPTRALLGRPVAASDPSLALGGPGGFRLAPINKMIGR